LLGGLRSLTWTQSGAAPEPQTYNTEGNAQMLLLLAVIVLSGLTLGHAVTRQLGV
jgi:hypothetical protein